MRPKKHKPFTLYLKETQAGPVWYARFWDKNARRYAVSRSTGILAEGKKLRRYEAEQATRVMLPGIRFAADAPDQTDKSFPHYVADFWLPDSPYVRECALVKKKPLAAAYISLHHEDVRRHIEPFPGFRGVTLKTLTAGHIRDWMRWMAERGVKGGRINKVMQAMSVAAHYAVDREELERDPFKTIHEAPDTRREKGILTPGEVSRIIRSPVSDPRSRLAVLLGVLCGLRLGEVRGLLWGDIGDDVITICHNYQNEDGLKAPKWGSTGTVPIAASVRAAIGIVRKAAMHQGSEIFVIESLERPGQPFNKTWFEKALARELSAIGIEPGEQKRRNLSFHSLRHSFVTLGRLAGISDLEIRALARHKSAAMMERYSHASQVLDFAGAREKLEKAIGEV